MAFITRRIWIRGHLATVRGEVDYADPEAGVDHDYFIPTYIVFDDRPELEEHEEITLSEFNDINRIYWDAKPFDNYEHTVVANAEAAYGPDPMGDWHGRNE